MKCYLNPEENCTGPYDPRKNPDGCKFWTDCPYQVKEVYETVEQDGVEIKRRLIRENVNGELVEVKGKWVKSPPQLKLC